MNGRFLLHAARLLAVIAVCLFPLRQASAQTAKISKVWLEHGVYKNGVKGMNIHVKFTTDGLKNGKGCCLAYFEHPKGTGLKDKNNSYCTSGGKVCCSEDFSPSYTNSSYNDFKMFMPNDEIHMPPGENTIYISVRLYNRNTGKFLTPGYYVSFTGTNPSSPASGGGEAEYTVRTCTICNGSGTTICCYCNGVGGWYRNSYSSVYPYPVTQIYTPCPMCNATGKQRCGYCSGQGVLKQPKPRPYSGGSSGGSYSGGGYYVPTPGYSGTPGSSGHSGSSAVTCSGCGGSGRCTACRGSGLHESTAYYTDGSTIISKCPVCGGSGKCGVCYGRGTIR